MSGIPCDDCQLSGCPVFPTEPEKRPDIAIIGEAPGAEEAKQRKPFVGRSGKLLRETLTDVGARLDRIYYDNVVMWRPPNNRDPNKAEIDACLPRLMFNLEQQRPRLIVPVGNISLNALLGKGTGITKRRGYYREIEIGGRTVGVLPTLHPAAIFRGPDSYIDFYSDLKFAVDIVNGKKPIKEPPYKRYVTIDEQDAFDELLEALRKREVVGLDLETTSLHPDDGDILSMQLSWKRKTAFVIDWPALIEPSKKNYKALRKVLNKLGVAIHNGQFDLSWLTDRGINPPLVMDTMLASHALDERQGVHSLKRLSTGRYRAPAYDDDLKTFLREERKRLGLPLPKGATDDDEDRKVPLKLTREDWGAPTIREKIIQYGGADADYAWRLYEDLGREMEEDNVAEPYRRYTLPAVDHFTDLERWGLLVDVPYHEELGSGWIKERDDLEAKMRATAGAEDVNFRSVPQLKKFLYETLGLTKMEPSGDTAVLSQEDLLKYTKDVKDKEAQEYWRGSSAQQRGKMKNDSTTTYMLWWLAQQHEFPRMLVKHKEVAKKISDYYEGYKAEMRGDRIHPRYRIHGTRTYRYSVTGPNLHSLQNIVEVKRIFRADEGYTLICMDYSQAEIRMLAHLSGDKRLTEVTHSSDVHQLTVRSIYGVTDDEFATYDADRKKSMRTSAKTVNFGINYGMGAKSLAPQMNCTVEEAEARIKAVEKGQPDATRWMMKTRAEAQREQEVASLYGFKRRFPLILDRRHLSDIHRQAVNMPIQSAVSTMTFDLNRRVLEELRGWEDGYPVLPWPHMHDGFLIQVKDHLVDRAIETIWEMGHDVGFETPVNFALEISTGPNWGELTTVREG